METTKKEFVIEIDENPPPLLEGRGSGRPVAIVNASSSEEALSKYADQYDNDNEDVDTLTWATEISEWPFVGDWIEPDGENEPICIMCIDDDGGFMGEEEELPASKQGPCWRCLELLRNSVERYID